MVLLCWRQECPELKQSTGTAPWLSRRSQHREGLVAQRPMDQLQQKWKEFCGHFRQQGLVRLSILHCAYF
jgi:hypothetical protein